MTASRAADRVPGESIVAGAGFAALAIGVAAAGPAAGYFVNVIPAIFGVIAVFLIGRRLWSHRAGLVAAALLAVRRMPLLLACLAVWSNLHAEVVLGVGFVGLFGLCEWLRPSVLPRRTAAQIVVVAAFGLVMTLASPYGAGLWRYLIENTLVPQSLRIAELQSPTLATYPAFFRYRGLSKGRVLVTNLEGNFLVLEAGEFRAFAEGTVPPTGALFEKGRAVAEMEKRRDFVPAILAGRDEEDELMMP